MVYKHEQKVTGWCTKYALTKGLFKVEGRVVHHASYGSTYHFKAEDSKNIGLFLTIGVDWFGTEIDARLDVMAKARRAIKSLDKKRAKLIELAEGKF